MIRTETTARPPYIERWPCHPDFSNAGRPQCLKPGYANNQCQVYLNATSRTSRFSQVHEGRWWQSQDGTSTLQADYSTSHLLPAYRYSIYQMLVDQAYVASFAAVSGLPLTSL